MWLVLILLISLAAGHEHFCGVTPEWEAQRLQEFQQSRRLTTVPALARSSSQGPFRISAYYLDMTALPASNVTFIQQKVIPSVIKWYSNVLRVYNLVENWKLSQTTCSSLVNVPANHQNPGLPNTDYVIYIFAVNETTKNYIAKGGFCALDGNSLTNPIAGTLGYNAAFYVALTPEQEIMTARHEIAHALAFSPSLWSYFRQPDGTLYSSYTTTVTERGHTVTLLTFPKALARAQADFGCSSMQGIELENQGAVGTSGSHWEKRLMANDFMVGTIIIDMLYTDITLAVFEDSGWYTVNYDYTTPTTWGHGKGCDFVNLNCISGGATQFSEWCTAPDNSNACSSTHTIKASCNYATYGSALPSYYQYFTSPADGGQDTFTDYCPYEVPFSDGDCKGRGYVPTWYFPTAYGEMLCDTCMCFTGTTVNAARVTYGDVHALCYNVTCSATVATITIGTTTMACPAAGGKLTNIPGFTGYLNCPPFSELCGTHPCINGCWGAGKCVNGICQCDDGYSGVDCSIICDSTCRTCSGTGSTCLTCYPGGMLNSVANTCSSCDITCLTCSGSAANQCSTCVSNASVVLGVCLCTSGFTRSSDQSTCVPCHSSCSQCTGALSTQCTACNSKAALPVGQSTGSCVCNIGYYMQGNWICAQCPSVCKACQTANSCTSCYPATATISLAGACVCPTGFYLSTDALSCLQCDLSCLACSGLNVCTSCKAATATIVSGACVCPAPSYLSADGSVCSACDSSCASCSGSGTGCLSCYPGGVLTPSGGPGSCGCTSGNYYSAPAGCQSCNSSCKTCSGSSPTACTSCFSGSPSQSGTCLCNQGFYLDPSSNCQQCSANCLTCDTSASQCTSCDTTVSQLTAPQCQCLSFTYQAGDGSCKLCDPTCLTCSSGSASACMSCRANAIKTNGVCACTDGFYWAGKQCSGCDSSCSTCSGALATNCLTCLPNAARLNNGICTCNPGYFPQSDSTCGHCSPQCSTCSLLNTCLTCISTATLQNGQCICSSTHQYLSLDGTQCLECDTMCLTCSGAGATNCLSCYSQAILTPATGPGTCSCGSGNYYSPPTGCVVCNAACNDCVGANANQCLSCKPGASLSGNTPTSCVCNSGFYLDSTGICQVCSPNCQACLGSSSSCTSCNSQTSILTINICVCLSGYYNAPTGNCVQCDISCLTCATGSSLGCLSCYSNAALGTTPGACRCASGYFPNPTSNQCQMCDPSCKECSGNTVSLCTACTQFAVLSSTGTCQCLSPYYMDTTNHICKACDPTCRTCSDSTASSCQSCYAQAQLSSSAPCTCICVVGTTPKPTVANCSVGSCDPSCLTCQNPGLGQCLSCYPNAVGQANVFPTFCICGSGFYPKPNAANCAACDSSCLTCSGFSPFQCVTCPSGKVLVDSLYCSDFCPSGQIPQSGICSNSSGSAFFRITLNQVTQTPIDSIGLLKAQAGSTASSDQNDPIAYYQQGWLFDGIGTYIVLPPNSIETRNVTLDATHTVEIWIRPAVLGLFACLLSKNMISNQAVSLLFRFCITDSNQLLLDFATVSQVDPSAKQTRSIVGGKIASAGVWMSVAYKVVFTSQTGSIAKLIMNNSIVQTYSYPQELYKDTPSATVKMLLGASVSTGLFFKGNIAELSLYNTDFPLTATTCSCSPCSTSGMCLSVCSPQQYQATVCQQCLPTCTSGCIRGTDCSLNVDPLCVSFSTFVGCNACKDLAILSTTGLCQCVANANLVNTACVCSTEYQASGNVCVQCRSYFAPYEVSAHFDSSYLSLGLQFARPVVLSTCDSLFLPSTLTKFGQGYSCSWSSDQMSLTVVLGTASTLTNEVVNLNYVNLYSTQGNCTYAAVPLGPIAVYPSTPPAIRVQLSVPSNFSLACSTASLDLDASGTVGGKGRSLNYTWTVLSDPSLPSLALYSSYLTVNPVLSIPKSLLNDALITVFLTVRNFFGSQNSTSATIQVTSKSAIALLIEGGNTLQIYASQKRVIRATPSELCSNQNLQYTWLFISVNPPTNSTSYAFLGSPSPPNAITIPANTLVPGGIYSFSVQVTDGLSFGTAYFNITVLRSPLIALLDRIDSDSSTNVSFIISGERSYDPDGGILAYMWSCVQGTSQCLDSTGLAVVNNERNAVLAIPTLKLKYGAKWNITLTISSDIRKASISALISFLLNPACDLTVAKPTPVRVNGQSNLQIELKATASVSTSFQWTQIYGSTLQFLTPASYAYLVIGSSMTSGATYGISLVATNTAGSSSAKVYFSVDYPPSSGTVTLSPWSGTALATVFTMQASGWEDVEGDYPLTYVLTCAYRGREVTLGRASLSSTRRVKLAAGTFALQTGIVDALGAVTTVSLPTLSVSSPQRLLQSFDILQTFLADTLDPDQTFPMVIAYSSLYSFTNATFSGVLSQLQTYVSMLSDVESSEIEAAISCFEALFSQKSVLFLTYLQNLIQFMDATIAKSSISLTTSQITSLSDVIGTYPGNSTDCLSALQLFLQALVTMSQSEALPDQVAVQIFSPVIAIYSRRISSQTLNNFQFSTGNSSISFPTDLLSYLNIPVSTVVDIQAATLSRPNSPSAQVYITIQTAGTFSSYQFIQTSTESEVTIAGLTTPISFSVPMNSYISNVTYDCMYLTSEGNWSSSGLNLTSISSTTASCNTSHLSSFQVRPRSLPVNPSTNPLPVPPPTDCHINFAPIGEVAGIILIGLILSAILRVVRVNLHINETVGVFTTEKVPEDQNLKSTTERAPPNSPDLLPAEDPLRPPSAKPAFRRRWLCAHDVFGLFMPEEKPYLWLKVLRLTTVLAVEMCIVGACYEADTSADSQETREIWVSYSAVDFSYAVISLACGLGLSLLLSLLFALPDYMLRGNVKDWVYTNGCALCVLLCCAALAGTVYQSSVICAEAGGHWAVSLLPVVGGEALVSQTILATMRAVASR